MNTLYYGDNLDIMREYIPDESVDLVYLEPPFNSKQAYNVIFRDKDGHFPPGNMGPKVESVLRFLRDGGKEAVITSYEHLYEAVGGRTGTHIVPGTSTLTREEREREISTIGR